MKDTTTRPENLAWVASAAGLILFIAAVTLFNTSNAVSLIPAMMASVVIVLLGVVGGFRARFNRRQADEELAFEDYRREHGNAELFEDSDEAVKLIARANEHYVKYFVPVFTLALGIVLLFTVWLFWVKWNNAISFPAIEQPLRHSVLTLTLLLICLVGGSYFIGVSRESGCRWLRPAAAWMFFNALLFLLSSIVLVVEHLGAEYERLDVAFARIGAVLLFLLAIEFCINFVIEFYRPRGAREEERPLYESRLLALFTEPGGIARNVAASLDYQFGFHVSEVWFYRFLERAVVPFAIVLVVGLWLQTCIVVINTEEAGIRERFGRVLNREQMAPGIYVKLPAPFAKIRKFPVERVQKVAIGYKTASDEDLAEMPPDMQGDPSRRVIVWSRAHMKEETPFIVASRPEEEAGPESVTTAQRTALPVPVYFMSASIPLYFKVSDMYKYTYQHREPEKVLEKIATREVVRYLANVDFFAILTEGRERSARILQERIQSAARRVDLGIDVVFLGLQGLHPPVGVGQAFDEVVAAMEKKHEEVLKAEEYAINQKPAAESDALSMKMQAQAYENERTRVSEAEAERFEKQLLAYQQAPDLFVLRSFLDVLETEGRGVRKYVVATDDSTEVYVLNLEQKLRPDLLDLEFDTEAE